MGRPVLDCLASCLAGISVLVALAGAQTPELPGNDILITDHVSHDKAPRLQQGWLTWTLDAALDDSRGTVAVRHMGSGQQWNLGAGCLPDIGVYDGGATVRVA